MEALADRTRPKVQVQLEVGRFLSQERLFKDINQPQLKTLADGGVSLSLLPNTQVVVINNKIDQDVIFSPFSQLPLPSEPFSVQYAKDNRICLPPIYSIDFTKICMTH